MTTCKGFITTRIDYDGQEILETRYALLNDGTVLKTAEGKRSNEFCKKGTRWYATGLGQLWLKEHAEFIGNYPVPSTRI